MSDKVTGVSGTSVIWVEAPAGKTYPAPVTHFVIDQKGLAFVPHVLAVAVGTTVDFLNDDGVAHNVFWPSVFGSTSTNYGYNSHT